MILRANSFLSNFVNLAYRDNHYASSAKNIFHALRILDFGIQIKENHKIIDYSSMNNLRDKIYSKPPNPKDYYGLFMKLSVKIK